MPPILRPDEYRGLIAIDHRTAGTSFTDILSRYTPGGYSIAAVKIYIANLTDIGKLSNYPIEILLKDVTGYKKTTVSVSLTELLLSITALQITFTINDEDAGNIDWNTVDELND